MTDSYVSGLWNAVDAILTFWAQALSASLEANQPPPLEFWDALSADLLTAKELATKARYR
jgi:hypothetical protein